jgi:transposase InsO family protein
VGFALQVVGLCKSTFYYGNTCRESKPRVYPLDEDLCHILQGFTGYELTLGYRKTTKYILAVHGRRYNKKKVYRHMKALGLLQPRRIKPRKQPLTQLDSCPATRSNERWEADLTYVSHAQGRAHVFAVQDIFDKDIVGAHVGYRCQAEDAISSLQDAIEYRFQGQKPEGLHLTVRVDRGCQYTANDFIVFCKEQKIHLEFCGVQCPNDKPHIESFIGCYKREEVYRNQYENFLDVCRGWESYLQWYRFSRPHGSLGFMPPAQFKNLNNNHLIAASF